MTPAEAEVAIRDACAAAVAKGWRIVPFYTISLSRKCCPLGALLVAKDQEYGRHFTSGPSKIGEVCLDTPAIFCRAFAAGFDAPRLGDRALDDADPDKAFEPWYALGAKLRREFHPEPHLLANALKGLKP